MATAKRTSGTDNGGHATVLQLRLYVAGAAPNSARALVNIRAICAEHFASTHELEIVDLLEQPRRALEDGIIGHINEAARHCGGRVGMTARDFLRVMAASITGAGSRS